MTFVLTFGLSLHFFLTPLLLAILVIVDLNMLFVQELNHLPDPQFYFLIFLLTVKLLFLIFSVVVAVFYFRKHSMAPKLIILYMIVLLTAAGITLAIANQANPNYSPYAFNNFIRNFIICSIYIPYLLYSKGIKKMFH